jgi:hypothetical protein
MSKLLSFSPKMAWKLLRMGRRNSMNGVTMPVVSVHYENIEGWHRFTSPQIPGFCVIVEPDQFEIGLEDVPRTIELMIFGDFGKRVKATPLQTYSGYSVVAPTRMPKIYHYAINS